MLKLRRQLAIDMGSSKIRFARSDSQEIHEDWNVVALQHRNRFATVLAAVGQEAMNMADTPNVEIVWPLENGVVWDYQVTEVSLFAYHRKHHRFHFFVPQVIAAVPAGSSEAEKRTLYDAVRSAFGDRVVLMEDLLAVGMAVGLDKGDAIIPKFLLHMGAGNTTFGVMSNGGLVHSTRIPLAGNWLDRNIQRHLYEKLDAWISLPDCQRIKHQVGTLGKQPNSEWHASVQDIAGKAVQVDLTGSDLKPAIEKGLEFIVDELRWFFKTLPLDILRIGQQSGMLLSGGCGYVAGISGWLADRLNLPVETADTPDLLVIQGMRDFLPRSAKFFNQVLGWQSRSR